MASDCHKNFRLRGIPNSYQSRSDVRELVGSVLSINASASLTVHSLAANPIDANSSVATLSFRILPDLLSNTSKDEWLFDLPSCEGSDDGQSFRGKPLAFDTHFSGFTPLQQTKEDNCHIDLIAISGLGGHAFGSFRERQGPFMWLRDALPLDAPGARVLIYGYDTRVVQSCSFQNLTDLGKALHIDIKGIRDNNQHGPMIFVGHSLGGLVMKEAIVKMKEENDEEDTAMLKSTLAFLFFGVPHQGMAIESLVPLVKDQPNRALLEFLNKNSALLQRLDRDFNKAFGARYPHVISFYETEKSPTAVKNEAGRWSLCGPREVLVDVSSATWGSKHQHPIGCNHSGLVKYNSQYDEFYIRVWVALRPIVNRAHRMPISGTGEVGMADSVPLSEENIECLRSLSFPEQEQRYNGIHSAHDTCDWLLEDPIYQSWIKAPRGLFWIKGNPGAGKSVLMKFAYTMMKHNFSGDLVLSFFIHGRGIALQKTPLGIFRALLNNLLESFPNFLSQLTKRFEDREMRFGSYQAGRWEWTEQELREFTSRLLAQGTENQPTVIFIDALDECGEEAATALLAYLKRLMNDIEERSGQVKICFSSRHYPILGLDTLPIICVDERNDRYIRHVIKEKLMEVEPKEKRQQIEKEIILKAQGGFQWAVLVAAIAIEESVNGLKTEGIKEKIKDTPGALDELYTGILRGVPEAEEQQTIKLFQWILFAERPLSAQELREALATDEEMTCTTICELRKHEDWATSSEEFERRVKYLSRGLVEFQTREIWEQYEPGGEDSDREAQFIHQSVPDYLLRNFLSNSPTSSQSHITAGHFAISRSCLRYLTLREVLDGAGLTRGSLSARFPLAPYAVPFLFHHIRKAELEGTPQLDLLPLIEWDQQSEVLEKIAALWRVLDPENAHTPMGWPFIGATVLHVLVSFGSRSTFDAYLQECDVGIDGRDSDGNTPLHLAIREGHQDMATALLHRSMKWQLQHGETTNMSDPQVWGTDSRASHFVDANAENNDGDTPLTLALTEQAGDVIFMLIEAGAELKYFGRETELVFYAIRNNNRTLLMKLIERKINLDGAVFFALKEPSLQQNADLIEDFISKLLQAGANTSRDEEHDPSPENPDDYDDGDIAADPGYLDNDAITLATTRDQSAVVNILLQHGISADTRDYDGRCALLIAAEYGYKEIASTLLKYAPESVVLTDDDGRTAISVAVENENTEMVMLCVTEGNFLDSAEELENVFQWGIKNGDTSLVKAVLQKDRSLVSQFSDGFEEAALDETLTNLNIDMTILLVTECEFQASSILLEIFHAAIRRHPDEIPLVQAILGKDRSLVDRISEDDQKTALQHSIDAEDAEMAVFLVTEGHASDTGEDKDGRTPLLLSTVYGYTEVVKALLHSGNPSIYHTDRHGMNALAYATVMGYDEIRNALEASITQSRSVQAKTLGSTGWTALMLAKLTSLAQPSISDDGASTYPVDQCGRTMLMHATLAGEEELTHILVNGGRTPTLNVTDHCGKTALIHAAATGNLAVAQILVQEGGSVLSKNDRDVDGKNALWYVAHGKNAEFIRFFVQQGRIELSVLRTLARFDVSNFVLENDDEMVELLVSMPESVPDSQTWHSSWDEYSKLLRSPENSSLKHSCATFRRMMRENPKGFAPIVVAATFERYAAVELLLQTGRISKISLCEAKFVAKTFRFQGIVESIQHATASMNE